MFAARSGASKSIHACPMDISPDAARLFVAGRVGKESCARNYEFGKRKARDRLCTSRNAPKNFFDARCDVPKAALMKRRHVRALLAQIQFLEKIIALVVDDDEGGEVLDLDLPDRFHAELGIFLAPRLS